MNYLYYFKINLINKHNKKFKIKVTLNYQRKINI